MSRHLTRSITAGVALSLLLLAVEEALIDAARLRDVRGVWILSLDDIPCGWLGMSSNDVTSLWKVVLPLSLLTYLVARLFMRPLLQRSGPVGFNLASTWLATHVVLWLMLFTALAWQASVWPVLPATHSVGWLRLVIVAVCLYWGGGTQLSTTARKVGRMSNNSLQPTPFGRG